jgi:hypothetical protein
LPHARKLIINFNIFQAFFIYFYKFLFLSFFKSRVRDPGAEGEEKRKHVLGVGGVARGGRMF